MVLIALSLIEETLMREKIVMSEDVYKTKLMRFYYEESEGTGIITGFLIKLRRSKQFIKKKSGYCNDHVS